MPSVLADNQLLTVNNAYGKRSERFAPHCCLDFFNIHFGTSTKYPMASLQRKGTLPAWRCNGWFLTASQTLVG
jgi:hypothetical protein